jgi:hypothetical protein
MMEIAGINIRIRLGGREVQRAPRWWIDSERHAPLGRAGVTLPDPGGEIFRGGVLGAALEIRLGYRGRVPATWSGTVTGICPGRTRDQVEIVAVDGAVLLSRVRILQSWENETPEAIIAWSVRQAGLPVGRIDRPGVILPRFAASHVPVWQVARQAAHSCQGAFDLDMRRWALWRGADGAVHWGDFDEPGAVPAIATGAGLIGHAPVTDASAGLSRVESFLLPDLRHSRLFRLRDVRRGVDGSYRALRVRHEGEPDKARTHIWYGDEHGRF